jgi:hypothetical protein
MLRRKVAFSPSFMCLVIGSLGLGSLLIHLSRVVFILPPEFCAKCAFLSCSYHVT